MGCSEEAITALQDVSEMLKTVLDFFESDIAYLEDAGVPQKSGEFPWEARDRAVTEMVVAIEGLRNRIQRIEGG
jgi:hypothetical protein